MNDRNQWLDGLLTLLVFVAIGAVAVRCAARAAEFSLGDAPTSDDGAAPARKAAARASAESPTEGAAPGNDAAAEGLPADHSPSTPIR